MDVFSPYSHGSMQEHVKYSQYFWQRIQVKYTIVSFVIYNDNVNNVGNISLNSMIKRKSNFHSQGKFISRFPVLSGDNHPLAGAWWVIWNSLDLCWLGPEIILPHVIS